MRRKADVSMVERQATTGLLVLGMHRSGTSALAHALVLAGADAGTRVLGSSEGNPQGHWEDAFAVELHDRLLSRLGVRWDDPFALPTDWSGHAAAATARDAIARYLAGDRAHQRIWMVKDPRLSLFGRLWRDAAASANIPLAAIVLMRHPLEVADSLAARDGIGTGMALLLWAEYMVSAVQAAEGLPSLLVSYRQLLSDWPAVAARIARLPGGECLAFESNAGAIARCLDAGSRHHVHERVAGLPGEVARAWHTLQDLARRGSIDPGAAATLAPALLQLGDLLRPYAADMREERRKLWDRIARNEDQTARIALQQLPADIHELRERVDLHQTSVVSAISVELRRMQETTAEAVRSAQMQQAMAEMERTTSESLRAERNALCGELSESRGRGEQLVRNVAVLESELIESRGRAEQLVRDVAVLQSEAVRLREAADTLHRVTQSRSWRITRPLRVLARVLRGDMEALPVGGMGRRLRDKIVRLPLLSGHLKRAYLAPVAQAIAKDELPDVFVWAVIDWNFRTQRPQHLARALAAKGHRVFYVSNNFIDHLEPGFDLQPLDTHGTLFQVHLHLEGAPPIYFAMPTDVQRTSLQRSLAALLKWTRTRSGISLVQHPYWMALASMVPSPRLVYDCMDHHAGFHNNAAPVLQAERELITQADLVIVTSAGLEAEVAAKARSTVVIRNACDCELFRKRPAEVYKDPRGRQVIGYYGAIAEWFDIDLVRAVAKQHADALVLLIGADTVGAASALGDLANVRFVGEVAYVDLPYWLHGFDVCLLPFKIIPLTLATNPVKIYEYLAAGKPVVAVDLPEMTQFAGLVEVAADAVDFTARIGDVLARSVSIDAIEARQNFASGQSWSHRAELLDASLASLPAPRVSIVVLAYNNLAFTQNCLFSIEAYSDYENLEVIVVDNLSIDGSREWLQGWAADASASGHARKLILNATNAGFAAGNNLGLHAAEGEYLVVLNNDTYVTPGWVRGLLAHLRRDPRLGLVGPVTNNIGNEARVEIEYASMEEMIHRAGEYTRAHPGGECVMDTVAFYCVAMPRCVFDLVGGLDEGYGMGFFEDDDYCRRVEQAGFRIACAEDVFVHHHLSASFNKLPLVERQALFERNKARYEKRWGAWMPHEYRVATPDAREDAHLDASERNAAQQGARKSGSLD